MNNKLKEALEPICATEKMKRGTTDFLHSEIAKRHHGHRKFPQYVFACCAVLLMIVVAVGGYRIYQVPVSYISVDVNPSVELALNRLNRVVTVTAYNDDGATLMTNLDLMHKSYTQAVELLLADELFASYLSDDSLLSFTVVSDNKEALLTGIRQCKGYTESNAECRGASTELMNDAHHNGMSFGKYQALLELSQYDKTIDMQDCRHMTMREIRDLTRQYTNSENEASTSNEHHGKGQGRGHRGRRDEKQKLTL